MVSAKHMEYVPVRRTRRLGEGGFRDMTSDEEVPC